MRTYLGVTASRGLAVGPVFRLDRAAPTARIAGLPELETARLNAALDLAKQELDGLQAQAAPSDRDIFLFQRMLLEDKSLLEGMRGRIAEGSEAADAVEATGLQFAHRLRNVQDEYISQRSADVLDASGSLPFWTATPAARRSSPSRPFWWRIPFIQATLWGWTGTCCWAWPPPPEAARAMRRSSPAPWACPR